MGEFFVYFFFPSALGWFNQGSILGSMPLCVSTSTDALSSEREGLLSHQLTELRKEVVSFDDSVGSVSNTVSHTAFALPLGAQLSTGDTFRVVT